MRTCSATSVKPESHRGTCRTPRLRREHGEYRPCRPHAQRPRRPQPPRETRFAAAVCARRRRRPAKAEASTAYAHNARAVVRTPTASRRAQAKINRGCECARPIASVRWGERRTIRVGSSRATMMFLGPNSCRSSAYRASSTSAPSRPSHLRTSSTSSATVRSTSACESASSAWYSAPAAPPPEAKSARVAARSRSAQARKYACAVGNGPRSIESELRPST